MEETILALILTQTQQMMMRKAKVAMLRQKHVDHIYLHGIKTNISKLCLKENKRNGVITYNSRLDIDITLSVLSQMKNKTTVKIMISN